MRAEGREEKWKNGGREVMERERRWLVGGK